MSADNLVGYKLLSIDEMIAFLKTLDPNYQTCVRVVGTDKSTGKEILECTMFWKDH